MERDLPNTGDHGSSNVRAAHVVTPLAGLDAALPDTQIVHVDADDPEAAARAAADCDAAIVIAGYTFEDEGEYTDPSAMFGDEMLALSRRCRTRHPPSTGWRASRWPGRSRSRWVAIGHG